jgi:hypothetical protein
MTALAIEANRACTGGIVRRVPTAASANPFRGSLLSLNSAGYANELVAGEPFLGIADKTIPTAQVGSSAGDVLVEAFSGMFIGKMTLTGVAQDDVAHRRPVFASDDNTLTFTASGNTLVGWVIGVEASNTAIILFCSADMQNNLPISGVKTLHATTTPQALTTADLGKLVIAPNTGAITVTLPAAADCAGGTLMFKKTTADALAVTLDGAGAETIDGAATNAAMDAQYDTLTIVCDGLAWYIVEQASGLDVSQRITAVKTLHATTASQALAVSDLGSLVIAPNTGAIAVTLPAAASCTGRGYIIKKTTADAVAVTIDPDGAETIDGGATYAAIDAANDCVEIISDGTKWLIIAKSIAA